MVRSSNISREDLHWRMIILILILVRLEKWNGMCHRCVLIVVPCPSLCPLQVKTEPLRAGQQPWRVQLAPTLQSQGPALGPSLVPTQNCRVSGSPCSRQKLSLHKWRNQWVVRSAVHAHFNNFPLRLLAFFCHRLFYLVFFPLLGIAVHFFCCLTSHPNMQPRLCVNWQCRIWISVVSGEKVFYVE